MSKRKWARAFRAPKMSRAKRRRRLAGYGVSLHPGSWFLLYRTLTERDARAHVNDRARWWTSRSDRGRLRQPEPIIKLFPIEKR